MFTHHPGMFVSHPITTPEVDPPPPLNPALWYGRRKGAGPSRVVAQYESERAKAWAMRYPPESVLRELLVRHHDGDDDAAQQLVKHFEWQCYVYAERECSPPDSRLGYAYEGLYDAVRRLRTGETSRERKDHKDIEGHVQSVIREIQLGDKRNQDIGQLRPTKSQRRDLREKGGEYPVIFTVEYRPKHAQAADPPDKYLAKRHDAMFEACRIKKETEVLECLLDAGYSKAKTAELCALTLRAVSTILETLHQRVLAAEKAA